ncbi:nucleoid-associated protein [Alishewanella jeotgali]|nr:nucleoid-associated protein [Alishewanella jeotgali]
MMQIRSAVMHKINKKSGETDSTLQDRKQVLPIDDILLELAKDVQRKYISDFNQHGSLGNDPNLYRFPVILSEYLNASTDFLPFTVSTAKLIQAEMNKQMFTTSGVVMVLHYVDQSRDWLLVLMLKTKETAGLDEKNLKLTTSYVFDIEHIHEAARVDLAKFIAKETPHLTFIKPRAGKDDPGKYFRDALGCTEYIESKANTVNLVSVVEAYAESKGWTGDQLTTVRKKLFDYCVEKHDNQETVNLTGLSAILNDQDPGDFATFAKQVDIPVSDEFSPHPATYKRLQRISKKFGHVSLAFDVEDVQSSRIVLVDEGNGKYHVQVKDVPDSLVQEIRKARGS